MGHRVGLHQKNVLGQLVWAVTVLQLTGYKRFWPSLSSLPCSTHWPWISAWGVVYLGWVQCGKLQVNILMLSWSQSLMPCQPPGKSVLCGKLHCLWVLGDGALQGIQILDLWVVGYFQWHLEHWLIIYQQEGDDCSCMLEKTCF